MGLEIVKVTQKNDAINCLNGRHGDRSDRPAEDSHSSSLVTVTTMRVSPIKTIPLDQVSNHVGVPIDSMV